MTHYFGFPPGYETFRAARRTANPNILITNLFGSAAAFYHVVQSPVGTGIITASVTSPKAAGLAFPYGVAVDPDH